MVLKKKTPVKKTSTKKTQLKKTVSKKITSKKPSVKPIESKESKFSWMWKNDLKIFGKRFAFGIAGLGVANAVGVQVLRNNQKKQRIQSMMIWYCKYFGKCIDDNAYKIVFNKASRKQIEELFETILPIIQKYDKDNDELNNKENYKTINETEKVELDKNRALILQILIKKFNDWKLENKL